MTIRTGPWKISDGYPEWNGKTVFSCFHCGGGSTMGYKLAGFKVLGGVEIDPEMMAIYRANHNPDPKFSFLMGVQKFRKLSSFPDELFNLDILDGSPPCSSFSMAGAREKKWGSAHAFREGQSVQHLDDLFFDFIEIARILQPKVVIAENVKGLIQGKARGYVKQIFDSFRSAGYSTQLFVLDSSRMGVPQSRERTFFIANRTGKKIKLEFNEHPITVKNAFEGTSGKTDRPLSDESKRIWHLLKPGQRFSKIMKGSRFNDSRLPINGVAGTITANGTICHPIEPRHLSDEEYFRLQTFPLDYKTMGQKAQYICGMSVPPYMMQRVALQVFNQLLS